ncbi:gamma-glutamylcyclotransferase family protein [Streptomyces sp. NPDC058385]|uniref:gamma-glutamylcyclotransferase family protein n=1 Tax=Streptomyces sp. NPDC058385 TaxID=3346473 RepID=UPI00364817F5
MFIVGDDASRTGRPSEKPFVQDSGAVNQRPGRVAMFAYGALQSPSVQAILFGRELQGTQDCVPGLVLTVIELADPELVMASGSSRHPMAVLGATPSASICGTLYWLSAEDLDLLDQRSDARLHRVAMRLKSGGAAWVYVDRRYRPPRSRSCLAAASRTSA